MNKERGYYSIDLGGKERTLHFSMNFWAELTDHLNISLQELGEAFSNKMAISGIRGIVYCGMLAYDRENKNEIDYDVYDVGNWLEDLTQDDINNLINSMMQSKILGNKLNAGIERDQKKNLPKKTTTGQQ
jgi:hypothetical protein|tara:strand:- start:132 stop:521 length:390 start_codon:yes stop_codon:yes gene_type:complete